jgi:hypothetical protein
MEPHQQLTEDYEAMNTYAQQLLCDLARSFRERFPATGQARKKRPRSTRAGPQPKRA